MLLPVIHDKVIHMSETIHDFFLMRQASLYNSDAQFCLKIISQLE